MGNYYPLVGFAFAVSAANISLNLLISIAASRATEWGSIFSTVNFALAFAFGVASLVFMASLYFVGRSNQFGMANGIILMGATSMIGGTLVGVFGQGARVHWSEWCIFAALLASLLLRLSRLNAEL